MKTEKLYVGEKYFLMMIENYGKMNLLYYQKNDTIAKQFDITTQAASNMVSKLVNQGYLIREVSKDKKRILTYSGKEYERLQYFPYIGKKDQKIVQLRDELNKSKKSCEFYKYSYNQLKEQNKELMKKIEKLQKNT